ncbi:MAG TPA: OPT family oligopeptide transporter [Kofleriaceae bacterium]|nr:OPT family oligopeptide transporter [Kofleriaceae bacterium]
MASLDEKLRAPDDDPEAVWIRDTYRPNEPNLTVRAVVAGILLGGMLCASNIYVFFKTGWSLGVTLTACIVAWLVFQLGHAIGLTKRPLGALENNALTTVASGAGYMTAGGNAAAFGALLLLTTVRPSDIGLAVWFGVISALGVFAAIPIKRQLINREQLVFPTGKATAETISLIHSGGKASEAGRRAAWSLIGAFGFGAALTVARDALKWLGPAKWGAPFEILGHTAKKWTLAVTAEAVFLGAGALMSFRTAWSMLLGGLLTYGVLAPAQFEAGAIRVVDYKAEGGIMSWTLWPGAAILVAAGLTQFVLDYKSLARTFRGLGRIFGGSKGLPDDEISAVEAPAWWFPAGFAVLTPVIVVLMSVMFNIPVWAALVAVPLSLVMGLIAARVTGETDVTPTKALGPVTQGIYGVLTPGNLTGNIMAANVTGGIGLHAADLLTTLKTGWLLGAKPRHQIYAQLFGVLAGSVMIVVMFDVLIDPSMLGTEKWPAPSVKVWANVSKTFVDGLDALPESAKTATFIGVALGVGLALLEKFAPKPVKPFIPSSAGIGIAMIVPAYNSIMMFFGAAVAETVRRKTPEYEPFVIPVASGLIAGESLAGIVVTVGQNL